MKKGYPRVLTAFVVVSLALVAIPASWAEHSWGDFEWARTANPLPLKVVDSVDSAWQFELDMALAELNISSVLNLTIDSANDKARIRKQCKCGRVKYASATRLTASMSGSVWLQSGGPDL